jgi:uncharacterized protein YodC (DUF2158 family)
MFGVGDVVVLKSGGPKMTVDYVGAVLGKPTVVCVWFEEGKRLRDKFAPAVLQTANSDAPSSMR